jgi:hypothetical protein
MSPWACARWRGGWKRRNIFSFDVAEFRFWLNVVVGFIDGKGQRRRTGNVIKAVQIEPFPFVANFAPDKIDASHPVTKPRFDQSASQVTATISAEKTDDCGGRPGRRDWRRQTGALGVHGILIKI